MVTDWNKNAMEYGDLGVELKSLGVEPERYYEWMLWKLKQEPSTPLVKLEYKLSLEERIARIEKRLGISDDSA